MSGPGCFLTSLLPLQCGEFNWLKGSSMKLFSRWPGRASFFFWTPGFATGGKDDLWLPKISEGIVFTGWCWTLLKSFYIELGLDGEKNIVLLRFLPGPGLSNVPCIGFSISVLLNILFRLASAAILYCWTSLWLTFYASNVLKTGSSPDPFETLGELWFYVKKLRLGLSAWPFSFGIVIGCLSDPF